MIGVLRHLGVFLAWNVLVGIVLVLFPTWLALPLALLLAGALLWGYLLRPGRGRTPAQRWATLRLHRLRGSTLRWSLAAVPVLLLLSWSLGEVYLRLVPVPPESLDPFAPILASPGGRLTISIFAIAVAPIVEEFVFRGLILSEIERRRGAVAAISLSAAIFALVHFLPWVFPIHFVLGLAFGFAVYATGSIWTGVLLHAANNTVAMLGQLLGPEETPEPTIWEAGTTPAFWLFLLVLALLCGLAIWTGRKLLDAGAKHRLRAARRPL